MLSKLKENESDYVSGKLKRSGNHQADTLHMHAEEQCRYGA